MPKVGNKTYSYTKKGVAAAKKAVKTMKTLGSAGTAGPVGFAKKVAKATGKKMTNTKKKK